MMKPAYSHFGLLALAAVLPLAILAADAPLPQWMQPIPPGEAGRLGGLLWPQPGNDGLNVDPETGFMLTPVEGPDALSDSPDFDQPTVNLSHFLLPTNKPQRTAPQPAAVTPLDQLKDASPEFVSACYQGSGEQFILDPGYQLSELERDDFERFLSYHARDSRIHAYVLLLAKDERLPADMSLARIAGGTLLQENTCLLVLPVGEPSRARLFFTNNIQQAAPASTLAEVLNESVKESLTEVAPVEQLHRMLVRLSIRLFWLQNHLTPPAQLEVATAPSLPLSTTHADANAPAALKLTEVAVNEKPWTPALQQLRASAPLALGLAILMALGSLWAMVRWRSYQLRRLEWIFPAPSDIDIAQRLGGQSCGAAGASLVYR